MRTVLLTRNDSSIWLILLSVVLSNEIVAPFERQHRGIPVERTRDGQLVAFPPLKPRPSVFRCLTV
jgi:hypothetical protein